MPSLSQLSKRRQHRFLSQLVEVLEIYRKRTGDIFRYSFAAPAITDGPHLYIIGDLLQWDFTFNDARNGTIDHTLVKMTTESLFDESSEQNSDANTLLKKRLILNLSAVCSCQAKSDYPTFCTHAATAVEFLRKRLERATTDEALGWLDSCVAQPDAIGKELVESLEADRNANAATTEIPENCRIVWRVSRGTRYSPLELELVVQRPKGRGGWTVGKRVRDPLENLPEAAFSHPADRALLLIYEAHFGPYADDPSGATLIHILDLLSGCPNVVWNSPGYPPAIIRRSEVKLDLVEKNEVDNDGACYAPRLLVDDLG